MEVSGFFSEQISDPIGILIIAYLRKHPGQYCDQIWERGIGSRPGITSMMVDARLRELSTGPGKILTREKRSKGFTYSLKNGIQVKIEKNEEFMVELE